MKPTRATTGATTTRHRVVTVTRGTTPDGRQGYAARCEEPNCGALTFGGFPSRTAARRALLGHEEAEPAVPDTGHAAEVPDRIRERSVRVPVQLVLSPQEVLMTAHLTAGEYEECISAAEAAWRIKVDAIRLRRLPIPGGGDAA